MNAPRRRTHLGLTSVPRLGTAIKVARRELGWNQEELSARSGVSRPQISAIESAATDCKASTLIKLLRALDCEMAVHPVDHSKFNLNDYLDQFGSRSDVRADISPKSGNTL